MTEQKHIPQNLEIILATYHQELAILVTALLGLSEEQIGFINPERPTDKSELVLEPAGEDPFDAVLFKLRRVLEFLKPETMESKDFAVYASDIVFSANYDPDGNHESRHYFHNLSRDGGGQNREMLVQKVYERYQQDFTARWDIIFGMADQDGAKMGEIIIEADYPALKKDEIEENFSQKMNPGLDMVKVGIDKGLTFRLYYDDRRDFVEINTPEGYFIVEQFIAQKIPTAEMIAHLLNIEIEQNPDQIGLLVQGFAASTVEFSMDELVAVDDVGTDSLVAQLFIQDNLVSMS